MDTFKMKRSVQCVQITTICKAEPIAIKMFNGAFSKQKKYVKLKAYFICYHLRNENCYYLDFNNSISV